MKLVTELIQSLSVTEANDLLFQIYSHYAESEINHSCGFA
jgi:hypothetical protein